MNKSKIFLRIYMCLVLFMLSACSTNQSLRVESQPPGAEVEITANGSTRKLGVTPLNIEKAQLTEMAGAVQVTGNLKGYQNQSVVIPPGGFSRTGHVMFTMTENQMPAACVNQQATVAKAARSVAEAQLLIQNKDYDRAISFLETLSSEIKGVAVFYDLLGNAYYLRHDLDQALRAYRKSVEIEPGNITTVRMIQKIDSLRGRGSL